MRIRFKTGFPAYEEGKSYDLPDELCTHYINAGAAELVDFVPSPVVENPKPRQRIEPEPLTSPEATEETEEETEIGGDDEPKKTKKRSSKKKS